MLLMRALLDEGISVPGEAAVIGSDDVLLGRPLRPRLSTVHIDLVTGERLAELVDRVVRDLDGEPERLDLMGAAVTGNPPDPGARGRRHAAGRPGG